MNTNNQILNQKLGMLFAEPPEKSKEKLLSPEDKKVIEKGLGDLFFGLAWTNWMNGGSLGAAWQKALNQIDAFVFSKKQESAAIRYLREVASVAKTRMSRVIMTNSNSNKEIECPPEQKLEWLALGTKWTNQGLNGLNAKIKEFEPKEFQENQQRFQNSQQNIMALWLWQNQQSHAA